MLNLTNIYTLMETENNHKKELVEQYEKKHKTLI